MPTRRTLISTAILGLGSVGAALGFLKSKVFSAKQTAGPITDGTLMIKKTFDLGFQWPTSEPFLFCVHHLDHFPQGTSSFGVEKSHLAGRDMGQDFNPKDGFRMYHGQDVPGFPVHPHRGFETVTIVTRGLVDHADSLGAAGRYGSGDVQWMTAGGGVQHSEMFPLLNQNSGNTLELFQIWLNLPKRSKKVPAHFTMFWSEDIPRIKLDSGKVDVTLIAGSFAGKTALSPPPDSWAADPANEVMILLIDMAAGASLTIPPTKSSVGRNLYLFSGSGVELNGVAVASMSGVDVDSTATINITSSGASRLLVMQAKPIGEPIAQHGPFVMNTREEIVQAFSDYQKTNFGGWPWPRNDMVHGSDGSRFAKYPDGRIARPKKV
jgi:redox-sensitive bicupin YhaK (pirin superfamily)